jgi:hypothetical protein
MKNKYFQVVYKIFPPNGPSFNIYFLVSDVGSFQQIHFTSPHLVHSGLPIHILVPSNEQVVAQ